MPGPQGHQGRQARRSHRASGKAYREVFQPVRAYWPPTQAATVRLEASEEFAWSATCNDTFDPVRIGIVSVSDRASTGGYEDKGLPALEGLADARAAAT